MGWRGGGVEPSVCAGAHLPGREAAGGSKARRRENIGLARHDPAALSSVRAAVRVRDLRRAKRSPQTGQPRQRESGGRPRAHPSRFLRASVSAAHRAAAAAVARVCLHGRKANAESKRDLELVTSPYSSHSPILTYRATRDACLKAAYELMLATGPSPVKDQSGTANHEFRNVEKVAMEVERGRRDRDVARRSVAMFRLTERQVPGNRREHTWKGASHNTIAY